MSIESIDEKAQAPGHFPKHITNRKVLPRAGMIIDVEVDLGLPAAARDRVLFWKVNKEDNNKAVWMLVVPGDNGRGVNFFGDRDRARKRGYDVEHVADTDAEFIRTLYEDQNGASVTGSGEEKTTLMKEYERMVGDALRDGISDIHIEKRANGAVIRVRKHGQMKHYKDLSAQKAQSMVQVIYNVLAETKDVTFLDTEYQAAAVNTRAAGVDVKLRFQSLPVYPGGFDVVLRVLPLGEDDEQITSLEKLGYAPSQVDDLMDIVKKPVGALVIAGTTGSGKSTTLKSLIMLINAARSYRCKIYTIEDPPEYKIPFVSQIPVIRRREDENKEIKVSPFLAPLVACMRADPDVLMIGEIRDLYTGDGLKKATQSGHQVLTTVHAPSALGIVDRLADFGISESVMGSQEFINGLVYQKLLPCLCPDCSLSLVEETSKGTTSADQRRLQERLIRVIGPDLSAVRLRGPGCDKCDYVSVVAREVCAEIIVPDFTMLKLFRNKKGIEAYEYWRSMSDGQLDSSNMTGKTALEHALTKVNQGLVSPEDVEDLMGPVDGDLRRLEQLREDLDRTSGGQGQGGIARSAHRTPLQDPHGMAGLGMALGMNPAINMDPPGPEPEEIPIEHTRDRAAWEA